MSKKVTIQRPKPATVETWVADNEAAEPAVRSKRLTVPISAALHRRLKIACVVEDKMMADVVRELLEKAFPEPRK